MRLHEIRLRKKLLKSIAKNYNSYEILNSFNDYYKFVLETVLFGSSNWPTILDDKTKKDFIETWNEPKEYPCVAFWRTDNPNLADEEYGMGFSMEVVDFEYDSDIIDAVEENPCN